MALDIQKFLLGLCAKAASAAPPPSGDPNFANVALLLHGQGVDGGSVFTDSSSNAVTVTPTGTVTTSTAQFKFGTSSIAFVGDAGARLTISALEAANIGAGDFTIETFVRATTDPSNAVSDLVATIVNGVDTDPTHFTFCLRKTTHALEFYANGTIINSVTNGGSSVAFNLWRHVAVVRASGMMYLFIEGAQQGPPVANTTNFGQNLMTIGARQNAQFSLVGNLQETRVTPGVARYTSDFTPPTAPFPDF